AAEGAGADHVEVLVVLMPEHHSGDLFEVSPVDPEAGGEGEVAEALRGVDEHREPFVFRGRRCLRHGGFAVQGLGLWREGFEGRWHLHLDDAPLPGATAPGQPGFPALG
ncbi:MAG: hypothetical protein ACK56F_28825, partial [bacterium]